MVVEDTVVSVLAAVEVLDGWSGHRWLWFSRPRTSGVLTLLRTKLTDFIVKIPLLAKRET